MNHRAGNTKDFDNRWRKARAKEKAAKAARKKQRGFFSTGEWYGFLALVCVVGYLALRGVEWLLFGMVTNAPIDGHRAVVNRPQFVPAPRDKANEFTITAAHSQPYLLEYKANGDVWVLWPDGRFIQVVPK